MRRAGEETGFLEMGTKGRWDAPLENRSSESDGGGNQVVACASFSLSPALQMPADLESTKVWQTVTLR